MEITRITSDNEVILELDYQEEENEEEPLLEEPEIDLNNASLADLMQDIQDIRKKSFKKYSKSKVEDEILKKIVEENKQTVKDLRESGKEGFDPSKYKIDENDKTENKEGEEKDKNGGNQFAGKVTVSCNVPGRNCNTKRPTYVCKGGGEVYIEIKVDKIGRIKNAEVIPSKSTTTNQCVLDNALDYAKNTTSVTSGNGTVKGSIIYNFIAQ